MRTAFDNKRNCLLFLLRSSSRTKRFTDELLSYGCQCDSELGLQAIKRIPEGLLMLI